MNETEIEIILINMNSWLYVCNDWWPWKGPIVIKSGKNSNLLGASVFSDGFSAFTDGVLS